jgi:hypothetical protein
MGSSTSDRTSGDKDRDFPEVDSAFVSFQIGLPNSAS